MKENRQIESFLLDSEDFIEEFQPTFVKYFVDLCQSYDKYYSQKTLEDVAKIVYKDVFVVDIFLTTFEKDIFKDMLEDGVMIGFLINRSMFFLLENYTKDAKRRKKCREHIETILVIITDFINQFEEHICNKNRLQPIHLNFDILENFSHGKNIMDIFKEIKDRGDEITFFNLYKGVPIQHEASIVDIYDDEVVFKTMQTQEMAIKMDGVAYLLKDENFDKYIKADIVNNDFSNNTVVLSNFTYLLNMPATSREHIRVHPNIMAEVTLVHENELSTTGKLFDLSVDGIGVVSEENNGIYAGAKIHIKFSLGEQGVIEVDGEVLNIIEYSNSYRYCIKICTRVDAEKKIINYVKAREVEILNSLAQEIEKYC